MDFNDASLKILKKKVENLKRFGIDIEYSKYRNNDLEAGNVLNIYIKDVIAFLKGYDFTRLNQTLGNNQWQASMNTITRMEQSCKELGINSFLKPLQYTKSAVFSKNSRSASQNLSVMNNKRNQILNYMGENNTGR